MFSDHTRRSRQAQRRLVVTLLVMAGGGIPARAAEPQGLTVRRSAGTGLATFVTASDGTAIPVLAGAGRTKVEPLDFFDQHGALFGVSRPSEQLRLERTRVDALGIEHTTFRQVHRGVPVFTGELKVHQDAGGGVLAVNGDFYPMDEKLSTQPNLDADSALTIARAHSLAADAAAVRSELTIVDPGWYGDPPRGAHLAWYLELTDSNGRSAEAFFLDAHTGDVLDRWDLDHRAGVRLIYDGQFAPFLPGVLARTEGEAPVGFLPDVDNAYDYYADVYDYFSRAFGRDSIDSAGMFMVATVYSTAPDCPNAYWDNVRRQMVFCDGTVTDDVVAHELTHGVTTFEASLVYQNQPGQLNESFSDVFGELVDLFNGDAGFAGTPGGSPAWPTHPTGEGLDAPNNARSACSTPLNEYADGVRWLIGEDAVAFGGAIRDMWDPTCMGDPDRANSPLQQCLNDDNGGVHSGSGVPNHAFAILTDGKTFNGYTVTGIGPIKAGAVWYRAMTTYLTSGSDFEDAYWAFNEAAADLVGTTPNDPRTGLPSDSAFTAADAAEVDKALLAVEMNTPGRCGDEPHVLNSATPAECGSQTLIFEEDFEGGLASGWIFGGGGPPSGLWTTTASLPHERTGSAAYCTNPNSPCDPPASAGAESSLITPSITLPASLSFPTLAFTHFMDSEANWDGGVVRIQINGGEFQAISASAFYYNPYNRRLFTAIQDNTNPLEGQEAFTGAGGTWGTSLVYLGGMVSGGETIRLAFAFGVDACAGTNGWYVDDVRVYDCANSADCNANAIPDELETMGGGHLSVPLANPSGHGSAYISDPDSTLGGVIRAQRFTLFAPTAIERIRVWGAYHPTNTPPVTDEFTVAFHLDENGVPGLTPYDSRQPASVTRTLSGYQVAGVDERVFELEMDMPVSLPAGDHWVVIFNRTVGDPSTFIWSASTYSIGLVRTAWRFPGSMFWNTDEDTFNLAVELIAGTVGTDCNENGVPDECESQNDCDFNGVPDICDIAEGTHEDCNANSVPDVCELAAAQQVATLIPDDFQSPQHFGRSVAVSGDTVVIGRPDDRPMPPWGGTAFVYRRVNGTWQHVVRLEAAASSAGDEFGHSVAISGDTVLVGAHDPGVLGAAHVFREVGGVWQEVAELTATDEGFGDQFGHSVALSGSTAIVGAWRDDDGGSDSGSAYVFREIAGTWQQVAKLTASTPSDPAGDRFGFSVAISGGTAVIGAWGDDQIGNFSGAAYVFREIAGTWQQVARLIAADGAPDDYFGWSVAVAGNTVLVGAERDSDAGLRSGSAYVFGEVAGVWQQIAKLTAADAAAGDRFGYSVAVSGGTAVIGAPHDDDDGTSSGSAYLFRRVDGVWQQVQKYTAAETTAADQFGGSVAIDGSTIAVGADNADSQGAAYLFTTPAADCNENGTLDECDIAAATSADCNADGVPDECQTFDDCNFNGVPDECELAAGDCNGNGTPDECEFLIAGPHASVLTAADGAEGDRFGWSVAMSDDTAIIGAQTDDGAGPDSGSAYVYRRSGESWTPVTKLTAADAAAGDTFGYSVALDGGTAVIGAYQDDVAGTDNGSAYVFRNLDGTWQQIARLTAADAIDYQLFGWSVAIRGDTVVVGATGDESAGWHTGAAYVFREVDGTWQQVAKLVGLDAQEEDDFGFSVALGDGVALVGAQADDDLGSSSGSVYVFRELAGVWQQVDKLTAADGATGDNFGSQVALHGDTAVIGARYDDDGGVDSGSAYVFREVGGAWQQIAKLAAGDSNDTFGQSVAIYADTIVIGAPGRNSGKGEAFVYSELGGTWHQVTSLDDSTDIGPETYFGSAVAVGPGCALVGVADEAISTGAAYVFVPPVSDCNANGEPDECDIGAETSADCDSNGVPDECEDAADCNEDGIPDACQLAGNDCNTNSIPDDCELAGDDCDANGTLDVCELAGNDCDANGTIDLCELAAGDCNGDSVLDVCQLAGNDCNANGVLDECDLAAGASADCNANGVLDACETPQIDCNANGIEDECELATSDCNANGIPDSCDFLIPAPVFYAIGDLPGGLVGSRVNEISSDGTTATGYSETASGREMFRWTAATGLQGLGELPGCGYDSNGLYVSADGSVLGGWGMSEYACCGSCNGLGTDREAAMWTADDGLVPLGDPEGGYPYSYITAGSEDGNTLVGWGHGSFPGGDGFRAFTWTEAAGSQILPSGGFRHTTAEGYCGNGPMIIGSVAVAGPYADQQPAFWPSATSGPVIVPDLPGGTQQGGFRSCTPDGSVLVGYGNVAAGSVAAYWTSQSGLVSLGDLPGGAFESRADEVSPDGTLIVGYGRSALGQEAVVWDENRTMHRAVDFLAARGLSIPSGWRLTQVRDVAMNGNAVTLAGVAINAAGQLEGWVATYYVAGDSADCNLNGMPDECENDCNANGIADDCEPLGDDCNGNGVMDICDLVDHDLNANGLVDECETPVIEAPPAGAESGDEPGQHGGSASTDGQHVAAGASAADGSLRGTLVDAGEVRVWRPDTPGVVSVITAVDAAAGDGFGRSVSVHTGRLLVGAGGVDCTAGIDCGAAYVYELVGETWANELTLTATDTADGDGFGTAVALHGDRLVIGAPGHELPGIGRGGAVYVFERTAGLWHQTAKLLAEFPGNDDQFGQTVALRGDTIVVGAPGTDCPAGVECGAAYVFERVGSSWVLRATLAPTGAGGAHAVGAAVSTDGNVIVLGTQNGTDLAYVYERSGSDWIPTAILAPDEGDGAPLFGEAVGVHHGRIAVGAPGDQCADGAACGAVFLFAYNGVAWAQVLKVEPYTPDPISQPSLAGMEFGASVALAGDLLAVGAPNPGLEPGECCDTVFAFDTTITDCNGNGVVDSLDVATTTSLDCNEDGVPDECQSAGNDSNANGVLDVCEQGACCADGVCQDVLAEHCGSSFSCDVSEHQPPTFAGCYADADGNGVVNAADRGAVSANIGQTVAVLVCLYDMDGNGVVNAADRGVVSANIGRCEPLPDYQNGSGLNSGAPDVRFGLATFLGAGTTCETEACP
jgi:Zn-dependent metalloprotease